LRPNNTIVLQIAVCLQIVCTVRSPAEILWLECGVVGDVMPCDRERERDVKASTLLSILKKQYLPNIKRVLHIPNKVVWKWTTVLIQAYICILQPVKSKHNIFLAMRSYHLYPIKYVYSASLLLNKNGTITPVQKIPSQMQTT